jgi:hypothetical protein
MKEKIAKVKVAGLVFDYDVYPRDEINSYSVSKIVRALEAGVEMPPIIVDAQSKRIIDGFHRARAHQRVFGKGAKIRAILRTYPDEQALFLDAIRLNASHGRQLSRYDQARCLAKAEAFGIDQADVAAVLNMTMERLSEMRVERFATVGGETAVLKRMTAHLAGGEITEKQAAFNAAAGGMNQVFYINQIVKALEAGAIDWDNEKVAEGLKKLHGLLEKKLAAKV